MGQPLTETFLIINIEQTGAIISSLESYTILLTVYPCQSIILIHLILQFIHVQYSYRQRNHGHK